jgi:Putative Actinobacterial Holin-X, holin superfamily III
VGRLLQGELLLARAEATEGLKAAGAGLAMIAGAAVVGLVGLNVLAGAAVAALAATGLGPTWAAVIVGLTLCAVAWGFVRAGRAALRLRGLWPDRALHGLRRDAAAVRAGLTDTGVQHV